MGADLGVAGASTDEVYAAMDWLAERQDAIEKKLAAKHLAAEVNPSRMALFDLTSSWVTGRCCELAARGYSRDGKKGLRADRIRDAHRPGGPPGGGAGVFRGYRRPDAFTEIVDGDPHTVRAIPAGAGRGSRHDHLRAHQRAARTQRRPDTATDFGWITALRAPAIAKLAADDGPLQMSLFDAQDLAEISHPDYPGERLIACRNPALAAERARKRAELLAATEADSGRHRRAGRARHPGRRRPRSGKPSARSSANTRWASTFHTTITDTSFTYRTRPAPPSPPKPHLDGIYVLRTSVDADTLDPAGMVAGYKNLANIERDFRIIKTDDLDLRPIHHRLDRTRQSPRADLPAGLLPGLAPAQGLGATDLHRRTPTQPRQPRRPCTALRRTPRPKPPANTTPTATRCAASAACSTTWPP